MILLVALALHLGALAFLIALLVATSASLPHMALALCAVGWFGLVIWCDVRELRK